MLVTKNKIYLNIFIIVMLMLSMILVFGGCSSNYSKVNSSQILQRYYEIKNEDSIYVQRDFVYTNSKYLTQEDATVLMSDYLDVLETKALELYYISGYVKNYILEYEGKDLVLEYQNIENKVIKGIFEEASQLDIIPIKVGSCYEFFIDIDGLYKKLDIDLKPDFKELSYLFSDTSFEDPLNENYKVDIKRIVEKIDKVYNLIETYPNSEYINSYEGIKNKYYNLIFSIEHDVYFKDIESKIYDEGHLEEIKNSITSTLNKNFKDDIENALGLIEKNNNILSEVITKQIESY